MNTSQITVSANQSQTPSTTPDDAALERLRNLVENPVEVPMPERASMLSVKTASEWAHQAASRPDPKPLWLSLWHEKEVCCLFADSNLGKSIYAVQIATKIAMYQTVLYFDFELSDKAFQTRYTSASGTIFPFPHRFLRAEINPNNIPEGDFEENIIMEIEQAVIAHNASVIIIDNLTWLCMASEKGMPPVRS